MTNESDLQRRAQQRESADPSEQGRPIPWLVAALTLAVVLSGVAYILLSEPFGAADLGDRRTVADLRTGTTQANQKADGKQLFNGLCVACHQVTGLGLPGVFPPLDGSEWVLGDERILANILLYGINGELTVKGALYKSPMPAFGQQTDAELAALATHVRAAWSNKAEPINAKLFELERKARPRTTPFASGDELKALSNKAP